MRQRSCGSGPITSTTSPPAVLAASSSVDGHTISRVVALDETDLRPGRLEVDELLGVELGEEIGIPRVGQVVHRPGRGVAGVVPAGEAGHHHRRAQPWAARPVDVLHGRTLPARALTAPRRPGGPPPREVRSRTVVAETERTVVTGGASEMSDALVEGTVEDARDAARLWWVVLLMGILWILYGWIVLTFTFKTVLAIAVFVGVGLIAAGISEFFLASQVDEWKWLWIVLGVVSIGAGIIALVWPSETFLVLAAIIGWYLMLRGVFDVVMAFMTKEVNELWWLSLVVGIGEILIGFWAVGYEGRSIAVLVIWVGAYALFKGISDIFLAFTLRGAGKRLDRAVAA